MSGKIELLAPGGDVDSIKAAIVAGADAVFCGLNKFNARNRAANISFEDLQGLLRLAHKNDCEVFLTLNIVVVESEFPALIKLLNRLINTSIDGVIVQDLGLFYLLNNYFKSLKIHASTQLTTHNRGQIQFLNRLNASRVNLSRELNIDEIKSLSAVARENNMLTEVFVHGSYCLSFSGLCYMSSVNDGKSGNRGRCSQPCREKYETTSAGKDYPFNLKDNSAYSNLPELYNAGVSSLKIEGRIKEFEYVYSVVNTWKKQITSFFDRKELLNEKDDLYKVFNRDFTNGFLQGNIHKDMFIDNPMTYSTKHLSLAGNYENSAEQLKGERDFYDEKEESRAQIKTKIDCLNIEKIPLAISISGKAGEPLQIDVKAPDFSFVVHSDIHLNEKGTEALNRSMFVRRFKAIDDTEYFLTDIDLAALNSKVYLPFKELTVLKKRILFVLNDSKEMLAEEHVPKLKKQVDSKTTPSLSVLISSEKDLHLCKETQATIYYQLPNDFKNSLEELVEIFEQNRMLVPWFPSLLIGENYDSALEFLQRVRPQLIVSNNTGIAFEAYQNKISWIAGPYLNTINSFSLLNLKENFNCSGAFVSNELNKTQIRTIKKPKDFELHYSIYHPIELMTSRQCLFHQVSGCVKNVIDNSCIQNCTKSDSITNLKNDTFLIEKEAGNYHKVYHETNYLNTEIVEDLPGFFSGFLIDLRKVKTKTQIDLESLPLVNLFENYIQGTAKTGEKLQQVIQGATNKQYVKGI